MRCIRRRLLAVVATGAVALGAPAAGASAQVPPIGFPFPLGSTAAGGMGGNEIGATGCVGTNRPSFGGNNGSTSVHNCGVLLSFSGPQIGEISSVVGGAVIGSPLAVVNVSGGPIAFVDSPSL
jgi:hypothetical protein